MKVVKSAVTAVALGAIIAMGSTAQDVHAESEAVTFKNDLIPVFTKAGCNTGACHGAAIGRGGFKLSLFGGNPEADYVSIVHQLAGRRVNLASPDDSLLVLKPTAVIEHEGRRRLEEDGEGTARLLRWIAQGADFVEGPGLERLEITPKSQVVEDLNIPIQLRATAHFADGTTQDVTEWTVFTAEDDSAVTVNPKTAISKVNRSGRHIVVARYLDRVVPIELIAPLSDLDVDLSAEPRRNFIDEKILETLATLRLPASELSDDATFLRRVTFDLTGRLPSTDTVQTFLADSDPAKREKTADTLLSSEEFSEYWTLQLAKLLRIGSKRDATEGARVYHDWLYQQINEGVGYDQIARSLITSSGDTHENGPANFYRTVNGPREQAEFMSELFMGSRLRCANCHNHPLDKWTQDDYHGLAAIFAKIEGGKEIRVRPTGEVLHPRTGEKAAARIPGERFLAEDVDDGREELVDWLTDKNNPYFAKAIVNRLWKAMMGRGLVEPTDDFRDTNPATHPDLLNQLADDFVDHDYDLRHTLRLIANSATYARSANATSVNEADDRFYSHARRRPLDPEVLADAISDVLGVSDRYGAEPEGTRAVSLFNPNIASDALDILGRCGRQESCETSAGPTGGLARTLHLYNGELLNARIGAETSRFETLITAGKSPMEIVGEFYLAALSRHPNENEREFWLKHIDANAPADGQREVLDDFVWALLTSSEFVTNH